MSVVALDTSAAVALLLRSHEAHAAVVHHVGHRPRVLTAHSSAETYAVLTRLPGDARLTPADAARLMGVTFDAPLLVPADEAGRLPEVLAPLGIAGGAVYDALVALAARAQKIPLVTRDARALGTYAALGATVELVDDGVR